MNSVPRVRIAGAEERGWIGYRQSVRLDCANGDGFIG